MSEKRASHAAANVLLPSSGRILAIDIVRGFAISWVILYHLWTDMRFPATGTVPETLRAVPESIANGEFPGMLTAFSDAFLRIGYLGVPLFMILSGLSLTIVAMRRGLPSEAVPRFWFQRFRRVMIPYWFGFAYTLAFMAGLAFVQWQRHGGASFMHFYQNGDLKIDGGQLFAGGLLIPRMFKNEWQFAPEGSLWFVLIIVQYYLLFPVLLALMKRIGPWMFLGLTLIITLVFQNVAVAIDGNLLASQSLVETAAPFRIFEFGLGMTGGYLMARRPELLLEYTQAPFDILGIVVIGFLLLIGGSMIDPRGGGDAVTFQSSMVAAGMALIFLPLVMKVPGRLEVSTPGRVLVWIGVISYTVLIVNEPLRSVTHTMRAERAPEFWLNLWVWVIYIPLTLVVARPLAVVLGLVEREPPRAAPEPGAKQAAQPTSLRA